MIRRFGASGVPEYAPRSSMGRSIPLQQSASAPFLADSTATVQIGPSIAGRSWHVTRLASVIPTITVDVLVQLTVYRNAVLPGSVIDASFLGMQAISETNFTLLEGEKLIAVWSGGEPPGTVATLVVTGEELY